MKAIGFVSGIEHAEDLAKKFREEGIVAYGYHSKNNSEYNLELMHGFEHGEIDVLISVSSLTTGFDMPDCNMILNMRPTKVRSLYIQMNGRVLRPDGDPLARAIIIDCAQGVNLHGLYDEPFDIYKTKSEASEERKRRSEPIVSYIAAISKSKYTTQIRGRSHLDDSLKSVMLGSTKEAVMWRFLHTSNAKNLITDACRLEHMIWKRPLKLDRVPWIMEEVGPAMAWMSINTIRSRLKKMLKEGKKIGGIRSYPKWFSENILRR